MKKYVLTFIWSEQYRTVLLISKNKPKWQKGLLNGIGGKYEDEDRTVFHAATREILEETGLVIEEKSLYQFAEIVGNDYIVYCFTCNINSNKFGEYKTLTDESVYSYNWRNMICEGIYDYIVPNLEFIVPLSKRKDYYTVFYTD